MQILVLERRVARQSSPQRAGYDIEGVPVLPHVPGAGGAADRCTGGCDLRGFDQPERPGRREEDAAYGVNMFRGTVIAGEAKAEKIIFSGALSGLSAIAIVRVEQKQINHTLSTASADLLAILAKQLTRIRNLTSSSSNHQHPVHDWEPRPTPSVASAMGGNMELRQAPLSRG
jgi:hypothetical protein